MSEFGIKYAPDNCAVPYFHHGFLYDLDDGSIWVTSMNRIRIWCAAQWVADISRGMILGLLARSGGAIVGEAVNSYTHNSTICLIYVAKFREALLWAIAANEVRCNLDSQKSNHGKTLH